MEKGLELLIKSIEDIANLKEVEREPKVIAVKRSIYTSVEEILKKKMIVFSVKDITDEYVVLRVAYPEHICRLHKQVLLKSHKLADPDVIWYLFKTSMFIDYRRVKDPFELADFLNEACSKGHRFLYLISSNMYAKGYIVCGGTSASIHGVVYEDYIVLIGVEALRFIFYSIPLEVFVYAIQIENP